MSRNFSKIIFADFLFNGYILGLLFYFLSLTFEFEYNWIIHLSVTVFFTVVCHVSKTSLGHQIFSDDLQLSIFKRFSFYQIILAALFTFITGWQMVEIQPIKFFTNFSKAGRIFSGIFNPNFKLLPDMLKALAESVFLALMATVFAIPFAFIFSFFAARNLMPKTLLGNAAYHFFRAISTIVRSIEAVVWAIIFSVWVGIGPFAGMLALMFHSVASLIKLYSEQIENIDQGQIEAIKSTGASTIQIWLYGVIPQILSPFLAFTIYRWDINVRMSTIVGFVGGGGIGLALQQQQMLLRWQNVGLIMWLIVAVVWIMDIFSAKVREKLIKN
ncbi:MAG: phosphonate ABC transporter, permease protein PhnE [Candidatus Cloacimonetes bacterium]|nr:phosphonate ABC transporter, permease protein PhnE [Candidatus Cloacimonadota bacterium]